MGASLMGHFQYLVCENLWHSLSCICINFWVNGWEVFSLIYRGHNCWNKLLDTVSVSYRVWNLFCLWLLFWILISSFCCKRPWLQCNLALCPFFQVCEAIMPSADWSFIYPETLKCLLHFLSSRNEKTSSGIKGSQTLSLNSLLKSFLHSIPWPQRSCCQGLTCWHQHNTGSNSCFCPDYVSLSFKSHRDLSPPLELPSQS